jgi:protoheme IX farnesyltransferase
MNTSLRNYLTLCKPRVVLLMLLTAWAGMYLAATQPIPLSLWISATAGIAFMSSAAAALNHIMDHRTDAIMRRTQHRPLPKGEVSINAAAVFAAVLGTLGFIVLYAYVNPLTAYLTLLASIGYAVIYTMYLKHATSQNIVIGGLSGAMPPLLGWTAVSNQLDPQGWILVLIIFTWTPAHFWALCIHRYNDYKQTKVPMLPITHGIPHTKLNIVLYSILTVACSILPFAIGMSGIVYLIAAILLDIGLLFYALKLQFAANGDRIALKTFHYSLIYLTGLFAALLLDHYLLVN